MLHVNYVLQYELNSHHLFLNLIIEEIYLLLFNFHIFVIFIYLRDISVLNLVFK